MDRHAKAEKYLLEIDFDEMSFGNEEALIYLISRQSLRAYAFCLAAKLYTVFK